MVRERRQQQKVEHQARLAGISRPAEENSSSKGEYPSPQVLKASRVVSYLISMLIYQSIFSRTSSSPNIFINYG